MSEGKLRCSGAPLFLKTRFGAGYELTISKDKNFSTSVASSSGTGEPNSSLPTNMADTSRPDFEDDPSESKLRKVNAAHEVLPKPLSGPKGSRSSGSSRAMLDEKKSAIDANIMNLVQQAVPDAKLSSSVAGELVITLPITAAPVFGELFQHLKSSATSLGVTSYGVCITTLEQVFIQLARESHLAREGTDPNGDGSDGDDDRQEEKGAIGGILNGLQGAAWGVLSVFGYRGLRVSQEQRYNQAQVAESAETERGDKGGEDREEAKVGYKDDGLPEEVNDKGHVQMSELSSHNRQSDGPGVSMEAPIAPAEKKDLVMDTVLHDMPSKEEISHNPGHESVGKHFEYEEVEQSAVQWDTGKTLEKISIQLWELLHKRFIIAKRDLSGMFFQIILPVIQIALVLSILTISISPAGATLKLNAGMFPVHPAAVLSGSDGSYIRNHLSENRMRLVDTGTNNSYEASR
jgi:hypothetical protein